MALTITNTARSWSYVSNPTAVTLPITISLPDYIDGFTYTVTTDVAGTGTITITGDVAGSGNVNIGEPALNLAAIVAQTYNGKLNSITFTPNGVLTATTFTIFIQAHKKD